MPGLKKARNDLPCVRAGTIHAFFQLVS